MNQWECRFNTILLICAAALVAVVLIANWLAR
jgi:hypothetical protein